jgi:hypothetical protein
MRRHPSLLCAAICCWCPRRDASLLVSAALLLLLALGVGALGLIPVALPGPAQPLELALLQDAAAADASGEPTCEASGQSRLCLRLTT